MTPRLSGCSGPWWRVHAVGGAGGLTSGWHHPSESLKPGPEEWGGWTKTVNEPHFIWLRVSYVCPQAGVGPGADWSHPRGHFWGGGVERVLVSLLAAFLQLRPAGSGRRWRDVEGVGTGEGRENAEWKKKIVEWRAWKEGGWGALRGGGRR